MFAPQLIQGRWLAVEDFEALQRLMAEHPHWSRRRLSIALCEALNWRTASGQLKDMSARLLLNKLAERGFIQLPGGQLASSGPDLWPQQTRPGSYPTGAR